MAPPSQFRFQCNLLRNWLERFDCWKSWRLRWSEKIFLDKKKFNIPHHPTPLFMTESFEQIYSEKSIFTAKQRIMLPTSWIECIQGNKTVSVIPETVALENWKKLVKCGVFNKSVPSSWMKNLITSRIVLILQDCSISFRGMRWRKQTFSIRFSWKIGRLCWGVGEAHHKFFQSSTRWW